LVRRVPLFGTRESEIEVWLDPLRGMSRFASSFRNTGGNMTTLRSQRLMLAPVRTVHDLAVMALGVVVAIWPLAVFYFIMKAIF
jgi:hypothetical protein